VLELMKYF